MKMYKQTLLLAVVSLLFVCRLLPQQQLVSTMPGREAIYHEDAIAITPLFEFKDEFNYNGMTLTYKTPPTIKDKKLALGFVFYTGGLLQEPGNALALLVAGYDTNEPEFYTDHNFNYFFEDAEMLRKKADTAGYYQFTIANPSAKNVSYSFRIKRLTIPADRTAAITNLYKNKPATAGNTLTPTNYWYSNERLNIASALVIAGGKEYKMGLLDENANGLFNDRGADKILIADKEGRFSTFMGPGTSEVSEKTIVNLGDASFAVNDIDPTGTSFLLEKTNETGSSLVIAGKIPGFTIPALHGENVDLFSLLEKKPYTLLDFWGSWCRGCLQQLPELKELQKEFAHQLQVIGLNKGDSKEIALKVIQEKGMNWMQGIATEEITRQLMIDGYPFYILLDKQGYVLGSAIDIKHILKLLRK